MALIMTASKLYILDTNVLLHDPKCLYEFMEQDIAIPMTFLDELDSIERKKNVSHEARLAIKAIEKIINDNSEAIDESQFSNTTENENSSDFHSGILYKKSVNRVNYLCSLIGSVVDSIKQSDEQHLALKVGKLLIKVALYIISSSSRSIHFGKNLLGYVSQLLRNSGYGVRSPPTTCLIFIWIQSFH